MPFRPAVALVRSWLWLILACVVVSALTAFLVTSLLPATYASTVRMLVAPSLSASDININDILVGQALAPTYAELATSRPVLEKVIAATGVDMTPDELAAAISTNVPTSSNLLEITVKGADAQQVAAMANGIAAALASVPSSSSGAPATGRIVPTVIDPAAPSKSPIGARPIVNALLGAAFGLLVGLGLAYVLENAGRLGLSREPSGRSELAAGR